MKNREYLMSEAYVQIEKLLGEVKARVLSVPCPECGGIPDKPVKVGEEVRCKYCGSHYTIESSLNEASTEALKKFVSKIIEDTLGRIQPTFGGQLEKLADLLQSYLNQVIEEARIFYNEMGRLPQKNELDEMLGNRTEQILNTIALFSKQILGGQEAISIKVKAVMRKVDSIRVSISKVEELLERLETTYGKDWHEIKPVEATLLYLDMQNRTRKLTFNSITIGRRNGSWELEARYPNGIIQPLSLADLTVSRNHFKIEVKRGMVILTDLGSRNGTYVNGRKIKSFSPIKLHDGDEIEIGLDTKFKVHFSENKL